MCDALNSCVSPPLPMRDKVDTFFHALRHLALAGHPTQDSALLAAHASESACTRNQQYLLALQKTVLLRRHQPGALQQGMTIARQWPGGCYKRAWALVNTSETNYLNDVAELAQQV